MLFWLCSHYKPSCPIPIFRSDWICLSWWFTFNKFIITTDFYLSLKQLALFGLKFWELSFISNSWCNFHQKYIQDFALNGKQLVVRMLNYNTVLADISFTATKSPRCRWVFKSPHMATYQMNIRSRTTYERSDLKKH